MIGKVVRKVKHKKASSKEEAFLFKDRNLICF